MQSLGSSAAEAVASAAAAAVEAAGTELEAGLTVSVVAGRLYENFVEQVARVTCLLVTDAESERIAASLQKILPPGLRRRPSSTSELSESTISPSTPPYRPSCGGRHCGSCGLNSLRGLLRAAGVGFCVKYATGTILFLISGKGRSMLRSPSKFLRLLTHEVSKDTFEFAAFLGALAGTYRGVYCYLRQKLCLQDYCSESELLRSWRLPAFVAGGVSGLSILLNSNKSRRTILSLLFLTHGIAYTSRFLQSKLLKELEQSKRQRLFGIAQILLSPKVTGRLVMMLASAQILYCYVAEPWALSPSYLVFLLHHGGLTRNATMRQAHERIYSLAREVNWQTSNHGTSITRMCGALHHNQTCTGFCFTTFQQAFLRAVRLYAPLSLIIQTSSLFLRRKRKHIDNGSKKNQNTLLLLLRRFTRSTIQSSVFLAGYVTTALSATCLLRNTFGFEHKYWYIINGMGAGAWSIVEPPARAVELGLYCLPRALESGWRLLLQRKRLPNWRLFSDRKIGEPVYSCLALALLMMIYETEPQVVPPTHSRVLTRAFGVN